MNARLEKAVCGFSMAQKRGRSVRSTMEPAAVGRTKALAFFWWVRKSNRRRLKIIWRPAAYGDQEARRVNVCFEPDAAAADFFAGLERELVDLLAAKSAREPKMCLEIEARMQSCLKTSERGSSFLKAKLNWDRARF